jgi:hypothetical protein
MDNRWKLLAAYQTYRIPAVKIEILGCSPTEIQDSYSCVAGD